VYPAAWGEVIAARLLADHAYEAEVVASDLLLGFNIGADTLEDAGVVADVLHLIGEDVTISSPARRPPKWALLRPGALQQIASSYVDLMTRP
jgi:hypothetical protein